MLLPTLLPPRHGSEAPMPSLASRRPQVNGATPAAATNTKPLADAQRATAALITAAIYAAAPPTAAESAPSGSAREPRLLGGRVGREAAISR